MLFTTTNFPTEFSRSFSDISRSEVHCSRLKCLKFIVKARKVEKMQENAPKTPKETLVKRQIFRLKLSIEFRVFPETSNWSTIFDPLCTELKYIYLVWFVECLFKKVFTLGRIDDRNLLILSSRGVGLWMFENLAVNFLFLQLLFLLPWMRFERNIPCQLHKDTAISNHHASNWSFSFKNKLHKSLLWRHRF